MVFLFSLINISFTLFFLLFGQYIESIFFGAVSVMFIVYFSKILSLFVGKESTDTGDTVPNKKHTPFPVRTVLKYMKKWSYYIAFLLFYLSLYGFVYGINLLYGFLDFSGIFHYISLGISMVIIGVFLFFLQNKQETIFLIFRSNCIVFTCIYSFLLLFFLYRDIPLLSFPFVINSILPIITLWGVLVIDPFFKDQYKQEYIFPLFLFYLFLVSGFYITLLFSTVPFWHLFLLVVLFFAAVYTFLLPRIPYLIRFQQISQTTGVFMGHIASFFIVSSMMMIDSLPIFYSIMIVLLIMYHSIVYKFSKNYTSFIVFLLALMFFYTKIFLLFENTTILSFFTFTFLLPFAFV